MRSTLLFAWSSSATNLAFNIALADGGNRGKPARIWPRHRIPLSPAYTRPNPLTHNSAKVNCYPMSLSQAVALQGLGKGRQGEDLSYLWQNGRNGRRNRHYKKEGRPGRPLLKGALPVFSSISLSSFISNLSWQEESNLIPPAAVNDIGKYNYSGLKRKICKSLIIMYIQYITLTIELLFD